MGEIVVDDVVRSATMVGLALDEIKVAKPSPFEWATDFFATIDAHLGDFLGCVAAQRPVAISGRDGVAGLAIAEAGLRSLESGRWETPALEGPD